MLKAERESYCIVQVGSQRRSSPVYLQASKQILAGSLGRVQTVRANRSSDALRAGTLRRGGVKLPEPLNFFDWQAGLNVKIPLSVDRFLNWRYYPEYGGGAVADLGSHVIDGIHMLTHAGYPVSVKATGVRAALQGLDTTERAEIVVEYSGGQRLSLSIDAAANQRRELTYRRRQRPAESRWRRGACERSHF
jgi:predicted dehydrogenase